MGEGRRRRWILVDSPLRQPELQVTLQDDVREEQAEKVEKQKFVPSSSPPASWNLNQERFQGTSG